MGVWDKTTPLGSEAISSGDDRIREMKVAIEEALQAGATEGDEAIFPGDAASTAPVFRYRGLKGTTAARPAAGQYGLYFNTTTNEVQRDNGTSWDDVGTHIPAGTVMVFYQETAPTGWTKVATVNDKALRVVSGSTGGTTGGTVALSAGLAHTHTVASHVHAISQAAIEHKHQTLEIRNSSSEARHSRYEAAFGSGDAMGTGAGHVLTTYGTTANPDANSKFMLSDEIYDSTFAAGNTDGATSTADSTDAGSLAYADVILASKD